MKRLTAAILWSFVGWYTGALVGWAMGLDYGLSPIFALALGLAILADPGGFIWRRAERAQS